MQRRNLSHFVRIETKNSFKRKGKYTYEIYTGIKGEMVKLIENLNLKNISIEEWEEKKCALEKCFSVALYTKKANSQPLATTHDILTDEEIPIHLGNEEGFMIVEQVFRYISFFLSYEI